MVQSLRAAVVGVGLIGNLHAQIYAEHPGVELVGIVDVNAGTAASVAARLGCRAYPTVDELLRDANPDLVSIATPEQFRSEPALACARAGKHLLLEKPLSPSPEQSEALIEAIQATGVLSMVNFTLRSDPRFLEARRLVTSGSIGDPVTCFARRRGTRLGAERYAQWTDLLISTLIHDLDMMIWLNRCPVERVFAEAVPGRSAQWGKEDAVVGTIRFQSGAVGVFETSWVLPPTVPSRLDAYFNLAGTKGSVVVKGANHGLSVVTEEEFLHPDLTHWPVSERGVGGDLCASVHHFIDCVVTGRQPVMPLAEALYAERVVAALKQSFKNGVPVTL